MAAAARTSSSWLLHWHPARICYGRPRYERLQDDWHSGKRDFSGFFDDASCSPETRKGQSHVDLLRPLLGACPHRLRPSKHMVQNCPDGAVFACVTMRLVFHRWRQSHTLMLLSFVFFEANPVFCLSFWCGGSDLPMFCCRPFPVLTSSLTVQICCMKCCTHVADHECCSCRVFPTCAHLQHAVQGVHAPNLCKKPF